MARKGLNIYQRKDGRWEGRYIKGRKFDGKIMYASVYGYKFNEVKSKLIPLKMQYANQAGAGLSNHRGLLQDWLVRWLKDAVKPNAKPATCASYQNKIQNHILPALGGMRMDQVAQSNVQQFVNALSDKGLAPNSVRAIFRVLNTALSKAVGANMIDANPCKNVKLPQAGQAKTEALSLAQHKALEKAALLDKNGVAVILALYTGMRIGEICALEWANVEFESGVLRVRQTAERIAAFEGDKAKTSIIFSTPKTASSYRVIPLPVHLKAYLLKQRESSESAYVVSCKGSFAEPRVVRYRFYSLLKEAGLPKMRFHSLRHTFATRCIERNVDVATLSRLLGHKSSKLTLDTYTDSLLQQQRAAMSIIDEFFAKETAQDTVHTDKTERIVRILSTLLEEGALAVT